MTKEQADAILDAVKAVKTVLAEDVGDPAKLGMRLVLAERIAKGIRAAVFSEPEMVSFSREEIDQLIKEGKFTTFHPVAPPTPTITAKRGED